MSALSQLKFRPALPGEFTRRAFLNNKLDLTEIEGLADLIHAETEQQRKQAILQAHGNLSTLYSEWRRILLKSLAHIEAYIDFGEEENIESKIFEECNINLNNLAEKMKKHLADKRKGEILRQGVKTVIVGEPNVGKSSLLNHLVKKNAAIVSSVPGTTRDVIELTTNISGYPVILADTAGLNSSSKDVVELEGIKRARKEAENADFVILVINAETYVKSRESFNNYVCKYIKSLELHDLLLIDEKLVSNCMIVINKIDLVSKNDEKNLEKLGKICISCIDEYNFENLLNSMEKCFKDM